MPITHVPFLHLSQIAFCTIERERAIETLTLTPSPKTKALPSLSLPTISVCSFRPPSTFITSSVRHRQWTEHRDDSGEFAWPRGLLCFNLQPLRCVSYSFFISFSLPLLSGVIFCWLCRYQGCVVRRWPFGVYHPSTTNGQFSLSLSL